MKTDTLLDDLKAAGIPVDSWNTDGAKTFKELASDIATGRCFCDTREKMIVFTVSILRVKVMHRVNATLSRHLIEKSGRVVVEGFRGEFHSFPLCGEFEKKQSPLQATQGILAQELGITDDSRYRFELLTSTDHVKSDSGYPGLASKQAIYLCQAILNQGIREIYRENNASKPPLIWV